MHRSLPFRIVGGPQRGGTLWLSPEARALPIVHVPVSVQHDDGTCEVVRIVSYAPEPELRRAIYQVEQQP